MRRAFFLLFTIFFLLSCFAVPVRAQDASGSATPVFETTATVNLTISPVTIQLETDPGKSVRSQMKIRNNSDTLEHLKISIGKFTADASGGKPKILDPSPADEYLQWIHFSEPSFELPPGTWKTLDFEFAPPETAALSYFYTLQVSRESPARAGGGETTITGVPSILLLANVRSAFAKRELSLDGFSARFPVFEYLPQEFQVKIKNTGNVYAVPSGNIFIDGQGKKDLAVLSLNPGLSSILPDTMREFSVKWEDGFPRVVTETKEHDTKKTRLEWDFSKAHLFRIGRYTAHLILVYDNGERDIPIESFVTFWVIPWKLIGLCILIVIFTLLGLRSAFASALRFLRKFWPGSSHSSSSSVDR